MGKVEQLRETGDIDALLSVAEDREARKRSDALIGAFSLLGDPARESPHAATVARSCRRLTDDPDRTIRGLAIGGLCSTRDPDAVSVALAALSDPEPSVRSQALLSLGFVLPEGIVARVTPLLDDQNDVVRGHAAAVLGRLGDRSVLPTLRQRLDREADDVPKKLLRDAIAQLESTGREGDV
jgi:HEAT repeat protein